MFTGGVDKDKWLSLDLCTRYANKNNSFAVKPPSAIYNYGAERAIAWIGRMPPPPPSPIQTLLPGRGDDAGKRLSGLKEPDSVPDAKPPALINGAGDDEGSGIFEAFYVSS